MRVVISDASPIHYLILIGEIELLPILYARVLIPKSVLDELTHERTPQTVKRWISHPPVWLEIAHPADPLDPRMLPNLDPGERDAILLALEIEAELLLMDERDGVDEARSLGLQVTGTLGVLDRAAEKDLVDLRDALQRLRSTSFRVSPVLLDRMLTDEARRRRGVE
jgi:predicted nucleic acid-binding protein